MQGKTRKDRFMALDVGSKVIGIAVADPLGLTARPWGSLRRVSESEDCRKIEEIARQEEVGTIVVGRPSHMDGGASDIEKSIQPLVGLLTQNPELEVVWFDERLSTREAEALMAELKIPVAQRRRRRDEFAAAVILRWFLEERE